MDVFDNSKQKCDFLRVYYKGMFGLRYSAESSRSDISKRFTLYTLTYPDIPVHSDTNSTYLESSQLVANATRILFTHVFACYNARL